MIHIVLLEPEMPSNTGNIGRSCLLTNSRLHLVRPFKFTMDDKTLKRAGMDYWKQVDLVIHDSYDEFREYLGGRPIYYATTKATRYYHEVVYPDDIFIMFGKESQGIPEEILFGNLESCIKIPMKTGIARSLNLANSVNIILFEALKQHHFPNMI